MKVSLKEAEAIVLPAKEQSFDPTGIPRAVKDAGFNPGDVVVTAVGTLSKKGELLRLRMAGPVGEFVLAGGAQASELEKRSDLLGQRVRVIGKLHPSHADKPPGLTVEEWATLEE